MSPLPRPFLCALIHLGQGVFKTIDVLSCWYHQFCGLQSFHTFLNLGLNLGCIKKKKSKTGFLSLYALSDFKLKQTKKKILHSRIVSFIIIKFCWSSTIKNPRLTTTIPKGGFRQFQFPEVLVGHLSSLFLLCQISLHPNLLH